MRKMSNNLDKSVTWISKILDCPVGNVTPYDVYTGKQYKIIQRRKEIKSKTLEVRRYYNRTVREQGHGL
jgi:hypothetical protein